MKNNPHIEVNPSTNITVVFSEIPHYSTIMHTENLSWTWPRWLHGATQWG